MDKMNPLQSKLYKEDLLKACDGVDLSVLKGSAVLVTGGLGLICSSVIDLLIAYNEKNKADISILLGARNQEAFNSRYGSFDCVHFLPYDANGKFDYKGKIDYIIHGAGLASPELYTEKPVETMLSNFNGVLELLNYSKDNNVRRLLYISSSEVYGTKETEDPFVEGNYGSVDIDSIRSSYPVAKRASEMICKSFSSEYGVDMVIVRPGHIYGPTASPKDRRISSEFAFKAARGENLEMKSSGMQKRSYCYSVDCAVALLTVLIRGEKGEAYNIGHDEVTTVREMAQMLADAAGVKLTSKEPTKEELEAFNPMNNSSLDNSRLKALGYKDSFTVREGLTHTVEILKSLT